MRPLVAGLSAVAATACLAWIQACAGPVPKQVLSVPSPGVSGSAPSNAAGPWVFHVATKRRAYVVDTRALLRIRLDTASAQVDSVSSHAELSFTPVSDGDRVTGSVSVFSVRSYTRQPATPPGLVLPLTFGATLPTRGQQLEFIVNETALPCSSPRGLDVLQSLRDLFLKPPDTLRLGITWIDSASYVVCRDGVPLRTLTTRTFRVDSATSRAGQVILILTRLSRTEFRGEGHQASEPLLVTGSGTGEFTLRVAPAAGEILSGFGSSTTDLTLANRLRTQRVHQTAVMVVAGGT